MNVKKLISLMTAISVVIGSAVVPVIGNAEGEDANVKYKSSEAWNETVKRDSVWQFLYRNNTTNGTYSEYTQAKAGNSAEYAAPAKNDDGTYNYGATGADQVVYADKTDAPGRRNALGKYWARPSVATGSEPKQGTNNRIVKQFTAPKSGRVVISAEDMSGDAKIYNAGLNPDGSKNCYRGALIRIVKKSAEGDQSLFEYYFDYTNKLSEIPSNGISIYNFRDIVCDLEENDKLCFEISSEKGGVADCKRVFWDPTVTYFSGGDAVYCSASGTEKGFGGESDPCTLSRAIELVKNSGSVIVDGEIDLDNSFVWSKSDKSFTIKGNSDNSEINISKLGSDWFNINSDVIFENIKIGSAASNNGIGVSRIAANGHHVVIRDTVKTTDVVNGLIGGAAKASVESTNLEVYGGNYNGILGGCNSDGAGAVSVKGDCKLTVGGEVNSDLDDTNWDKTRRAVIHGGGYGGSVNGESVLTLTENAKAKYVYGGQNGGYAATNNGKVTVNIRGGSFMNVFAILKNTKNVNNAAVKIENTNAEINMTGGKAEALIGVQESISGNVTINAIGGTVTRRIIAGTYNEWSLGWKTDNYVKGTVTVVLGDKLNGFIDTQYGRGIFGGSRAEKKHDDEVGTLIFMNGSYEKLKSAVATSKDQDVCTSSHDYIVAVSGDGTVVPKSAGVITLKSSDGYIAYANGEETPDIDYTLKSGENTIEFLSASDRKAKISGIDTSNGVISVKYSGVSVENAKVIAALYDSTGKTLLDIADSNADTSTGTISFNPKFSYSMQSGQNYVVSAMIWNEFDSMKPLCESKSETFTIN